MRIKIISKGNPRAADPAIIIQPAYECDFFYTQHQKGNGDWIVAVKGEEKTWIGIDLKTEIVYCYNY